MRPSRALNRGRGSENKPRQESTAYIRLSMVALLAEFGGH
jgi:hypothetical protein